MVNDIERIIGAQGTQTQQEIKKQLLLISTDIINQRRINAIKKVRDCTGLGLKESKDIVFELLTLYENNPGAYMYYVGMCIDPELSAAEVNYSKRHNFNVELL